MRMSKVTITEVKFNVNYKSKMLGNHRVGEVMLVNEFKDEQNEIKELVNIGICHITKQKNKNG